MRADIRISRSFPVPPERVFAAWLDAGTAGRWLFATASRALAEVEIDARVGGAYRLVERHRGLAHEHAGRYLEIVPPRRVAFTLAVDGMPAPPTRVTVDIAPDPNGCALVLSHEDVAAEDAEGTEGRWLGILYGLEVALDEPA
jgi:uncharacterized protein YndB with AHSA1/START domain